MEGLYKIFYRGEYNEATNLFREDETDSQLLQRIAEAGYSPISLAYTPSSTYSKPDFDYAHGGKYDRIVSSGGTTAILCERMVK